MAVFSIISASITKTQKNFSLNLELEAGGKATENSGTHGRKKTLLINVFINNVFYGLAIVFYYF